MNGKPVEPLSAEERELAALLGRTGPHGEPSPSLDAKILSAARAAVTRDGARPATRRRRWPALAGLAASVLVAAGIAWQLRPQREAMMRVSEAPASAAVVVDAPADNAAASVTASPAPEAPASTEAPPALEQPAPPKPAAPERRRAAPASAGMREAPPVEVAELRPMDIPAPAKAVALPPPPPPASAPPAPPAPAAPVESHADEYAAEPSPRAFAPAPGAAREEAVAGRQQAETAEAASASLHRAAKANAEAEARYSADDSRTLDSIVVTGTVLILADIPATEDAKLSKADWLQRIRQRKAQGDEDGARASLRLFVGKHPRARLPSDLRGLLEE